MAFKDMFRKSSSSGDDGQENNDEERKKFLRAAAKAHGKKVVKVGKRIIKRVRGILRRNNHTDNASTVDDHDQNQPARPLVIGSPMLHETTCAQVNNPAGLTEIQRMTPLIHTEDVPPIPTHLQQPRRAPPIPPLGAAFLWQNRPDVHLQMLEDALEDLRTAEEAEMRRRAAGTNGEAGNSNGFVLTDDISELNL